MKNSYIVDNEAYHQRVYAVIGFVEKKILGISAIPAWDGLEKRAAKAFAKHETMPPKLRPRFPRVVTEKSLFHYGLQAYRRKTYMKEAK